MMFQVLYRSGFRSLILKRDTILPYAFEVATFAFAIDERRNNKVKEYDTSLPVQVEG